MEKGTRKIADLNGSHEIEFRNVSFKYPGADKEVLHDISIKLRSGEKLSIVGLNGAGKTTFIKLLCRLYDVTSGEILLDGVNIREYDYDEYMKCFSVVSRISSFWHFPPRITFCLVKRTPPKRLTSFMKRSDF